MVFNATFNNISDISIFRSPTDDCSKFCLEENILFIVFVGVKSRPLISQ
jgi:hypothetical protein